MVIQSVRCHGIICPYLSASAGSLYITLAENELLPVFVDFYKASLNLNILNSSFIHSFIQFYFPYQRTKLIIKKTFKNKSIWGM